MESEECPRCLGEGRTGRTRIVRREIPSGYTYKELEEIDDECPVCDGLGYREHLERCYRCSGTGREECDVCYGSGETECLACEGRGRTYRATICSVQTKYEETPRSWSTGPVPEKYMEVARVGYPKEEELPPPSDSIIKMERISWSVPVAYIEYEFSGKTYVLCEVGYGLKKAAGKLKFDIYPRSLKKLATFIASIAFFALIVAAVVLFAIG